ncbi:hypothetical protein ABS767_17570, partial [Sphingomonas sp. ST-64]
GATLGTLVAARVSSASGVATAGAIRANSPMVGGSSLGPDGPDIIVTGRPWTTMDEIAYRVSQVVSFAESLPQRADAAV